MALAPASRQLVLRVAASPVVHQLVVTRGQALVRRFVAGEHLDDALKVEERLRMRGLGTILDLLGESVATESEADRAKDEWMRILSVLKERNLSPDVSVKLSQLGLHLDEERCRDRLESLVKCAKDAGVTVWIDMEESALTEATLKVFEALRPSFANLAIVLQAYLYRTRQDLERLAPLQPKVRLVKGAYLEPPEVAFPRKKDVDRNYAHLLRRSVELGLNVAAATHDPNLLALGRQLASQAPQRVEFQLLYGVRPDLQRQLAAQGYRTLVYVPFGTQWYPYFSRRLAERPANVWFVARSLLYT
jgi:proline dehydrogenase